MSNASKPGFSTDDASMLVAMRAVGVYMAGRARGEIGPGESIDGYDLDGIVRALIEFSRAECGHDPEPHEQFLRIVDIAETLAMFAGARVR